VGLTVAGVGGQGLVHLHNLRRLHRDVKGGNILVNDEGDIKIGADRAGGYVEGTLTHPRRCTSRLWCVGAAGHDHVASQHLCGHPVLDGARGDPVALL
jgi:hypothetical protein